MLARKAVSQSYSPSAEILRLMQSFKEMTNECIRIGLARDASTLRRLSLLSYHSLARFRVPSDYKLCAISKAAGILASRKKTMRRGYRSKSPFLKKLMLTCYDFRISDGAFEWSLRRQHLRELNRHFFWSLATLASSFAARSFVNETQFLLPLSPLLLLVSPMPLRRAP